ncbi:MAG TPA: hypothetical protein VGD22_05430 [Sphingobacteriaceae bacterium]
MEKPANTLQEVQTILKFTYGIIPIVAGADKFTNFLADWGSYLNPSIQAILPFNTNTLMMIVGIIEIIAGTLVFVNPVKGGYLVSAWLVLIAVSLLASGSFLDVAVRDLAMAIGAWSLSKLSASLKN